MLTIIDKTEVPTHGTGERSEIRKFAMETLKDFFEICSFGEIAEVTGAPEVDAADEIKRADKIIGAFKTELYYSKNRQEVRIFRRKNRIFLERKKPIEIRKQTRRLGVYSQC